MGEAVINKIEAGKIYKMQTIIDYGYEYYFIISIDIERNMINYYNLKTPNIISTASYFMSKEFLEGA